MGWYLCYFMHRHLDFRVAEFTALAELAGCGDTLQWRKPHGDAEHSPLWHVWLPSDAHAEEIMRRSILTKALIELWGEGEDVAALKSAIDAYPDERKAPFLAADRTFKVEIEDFGKSAHGTREDNWSPIVHRIDALKPSVEFLGRARMKNPDNLFWSVEVAPDLDGKGLPGDIPSRVYFGRVVARCDRSCIAKYDLTRRRYLGPTSMDVEMALIMCNMIHARPGGVVWDPFCGTGSILIAAAHYGAMTLGTDIDIRVIRWGKKDKRTGEPVDVWTNFEDYGLPPPVGLVRMDLHKNSWAGMERVEGTLQGVVGDPPYGVRAGDANRAGANGSRTEPSRPCPRHTRRITSRVPCRIPSRSAWTICWTARRGCSASADDWRFSYRRRLRPRTPPPRARTKCRATRRWNSARAACNSCPRDGVGD